MKIVKKKSFINLYHVSDENHSGEIFKPRIPLSSIDDEEYENQRIKRVCFSSTLSGAFRAVDYGDRHVQMYVHVPEILDEIIKDGKLYKPDDKEVYDVNYTNEYWVRTKVKMKCIGLAEFFYKSECWEYRPSVKIKWIERYE